MKFSTSTSSEKNNCGNNSTYEAAIHPATVTRKTPATLGRFNELTPPPPAPATQAPPPGKR